ncbi:alpha/beta hydrolase [Bradyrhizobium prioriisuperbiae]|uniref:alpha/beta fold hydrolase n=1 Tax=Bradyrhizobium prioriisuperbiae TaxID=2854389 RepID=UPI0028EF237A|nr:alpha/beta hydrolase [Bradyrhizobium prioritasuperba]
MADQKSKSEFVDIGSGRIAFDVIGQGPLVVLSHGMGDNRSAYRFLAPLIAHAGYRVASVDLRGHGKSSIGWASYTHADSASDLIEVIRKLDGGPATIVGQSFSGGVATIAAAKNPDLVNAIVEICPFTRPPSFSLPGLLKNAHHRRGALLLIRFLISGSVKTWLKYLDVAYPGSKPSDWNAWLSALEMNLREPGRVKPVQSMAGGKLAEAGAQLPNVRCPALVVMGSDDPDWPNPEAEAAAIVGLLLASRARYVMIEGAGHYPHAQYPQQVADAVLPFLAQLTNA